MGLSERGYDSFIVPQIFRSVRISLGNKFLVFKWRKSFSFSSCASGETLSKLLSWKRRRQLKEDNAKIDKRKATRENRRANIFAAASGRIVVVW